MSNPDRKPVGQAWLLRNLGLAVPSPSIESYIVAGARRTESRGGRTIELYPKRYAPRDSVVAHLRFALRHEAFDLGVLVAALREIEPGELEAWVRAQPTGAFSRRMWFLYETFTGRTLDLEDAGAGNYVGALDPRRHVAARRRNSRRHRVADNLLGGPGLCPTVRGDSGHSAGPAIRRRAQRSSRLRPGRQACAHSSARRYRGTALRGG